MFVRVDLQRANDAFSKCVNCTDRELRTGSVCPESAVASPSAPSRRNPPSSDDEPDGSFAAMSNIHVPMIDDKTRCKNLLNGLALRPPPASFIINKSHKRGASLMD